MTAKELSDAYARFYMLGILYSDLDRTVDQVEKFLGSPLGPPRSKHAAGNSSVRTSDAIWIELLREVRTLINHGLSQTRLKNERGALSISSARRLYAQAEPRSTAPGAKYDKFARLVDDVEHQVKRLIKKDQRAEAESLVRAAKTFLRQYYAASVPKNPPKSELRAVLPQQFIEESAALWEKTRKLALEKINSLSVPEHL